MNLERNYRAARRLLGGPNPRLAAAIEAGRIKDAEARASVRADIEAGADARALYEAETDKARRVALLGVLRRGMKALDQ